jgi:hypothetical protein
MDLTKKETETSRALYWSLQEAQGSLNKALNETALAHGLNVEKERWKVSNDFKRFEQVK